MSMKSPWIVAAVAGLALLAGCHDKGTKDASAGVPTSDTGLNTSGTGDTGAGNGNALGGADLAQHSVYFDFDKADLKPEGQAVVAAWAKYLAATPTAKVRLEGNTDERGTREYNVALGERRGQSVSDVLKSDGVAATQIEIVSYGKERPVCTEHAESCWSQNRRVDLIQQ